MEFQELESVDTIITLSSLTAAFLCNLPIPSNETYPDWIYNYEAKKYEIGMEIGVWQCPKARS
jgi:hypothetical protein